MTNRYGLSKHADFYWQVSWLDLAIVVYLTVWLVKVRQTILDRAPENAIAGGKAALGAAVDQLFAGWIELAAQQTATGGDFSYGPATHALLHDPLDPRLDNLDPMYLAFVAGRSMRDVEATVPLEICQPNGAKLILPQGGA